VSTYKVGQILYVVLHKEATVYPMMCVKEVTERTLDGEVTTYMVRGKEADKVMALSDVDGEVYDSTDKVRSVLIERLSSAVNKKVDAAKAKATEWYASGFEEASDDPLALIKKPASNPESVPVKRRRRVSNETAELASEIAAESSGEIIELPDGTKARIRNVQLPSALQG
jgi:hypothetical protein